MTCRNFKFCLDANINSQNRIIELYFLSLYLSRHFFYSVAKIKMPTTRTTREFSPSLSSLKRILKSEGIYLINVKKASCNIFFCEALRCAPGKPWQNLKPYDYRAVLFIYSKYEQRFSSYKEIQSGSPLGF